MSRTSWTRCRQSGAGRRSKHSIRFRAQPLIASLVFPWDRMDAQLVEKQCRVLASVSRGRRRRQERQRKVPEGTRIGRANRLEPLVSDLISEPRAKEWRRGEDRVGGKEFKIHAGACCSVSLRRRSLSERCADLLRWCSSSTSSTSGLVAGVRSSRGTGAQRQHFFLPVRFVVDERHGK